MAVEVDDTRKHRVAAFLDDPFQVMQAKRGRCSPSATADSVADLGINMEFDPVEAVQFVFPGADPQTKSSEIDGIGNQKFRRIIHHDFSLACAKCFVYKPLQGSRLPRGYLEASGNVLDAAIRSFRDYLASDSATTNAGASSSGVASDVPVMNTPANRIEWVELIVKEMSSASDLNHARNRVFRILEMFDKCAANYSTPDEAHKMRECIVCRMRKLVNLEHKLMIDQGSGTAGWMKGTTDGAGGKVMEKYGKELVKAEGMEKKGRI
ncbi:unnamed protein product [Triticum turgidum subsp. durum]|uniref:Uncharacterized protein n=1 Tax=Triticum turgidum subsp. durum TaxID=4567 RepID=A0A9R0SAE9_TRITD|nr:unnamed protein product [Triticum turgidum subsp. durum]